MGLLVTCPSPWVWSNSAKYRWYRDRVNTRSREACPESSVVSKGKKYFPGCFLFTHWLLTIRHFVLKQLRRRFKCSSISESIGVGSAAWCRLCRFRSRCYSPYKQWHLKKCFSKVQGNGNVYIVVPRKKCFNERKERKKERKPTISGIFYCFLKFKIFLSFWGVFFVYFLQAQY